MNTQINQTKPKKHSFTRLPLKATDLRKKPHLQLLQICYQTGQHPYLISNTWHPYLTQRGHIYTVYFRHVTSL